MRNLLFVALCIGASACSSPEPEPPPAKPQADPVPVVDKGVPEPSPPAEMALPDDTGVPELAHGNHFIFGLRMPRGMMPMKTSAKGVHRFEGTHSLEALRKYLVRQLSEPVSIERNRFSEGYFVASAQAKERAANGDDKSFNVKIFPGSLGGGAVEVWLAGTVVGNPHKTGMDTYRAARRHHQPESEKAEPVPTPQYSSRGEKAKATFRVFEKMANGEPLTEEDYNSPYFTDM